MSGHEAGLGYGMKGVRARLRAASPEESATVQVYKDQATYRKVPGLKVWWKWSRCPWSRIGRLSNQVWGWKLSNQGYGRAHGRFGGGWTWKLGMIRGGTQLLIEWIWGTLQIKFDEPVERLKPTQRKEFNP